MIAQRYSVSSISSTLFMKGGNVLRKVVGVVKYSALKQILEKFKTY